jgi:hypothetical protein
MGSSGEASTEEKTWVEWVKGGEVMDSFSRSNVPFRIDRRGVSARRRCETEVSKVISW